MHIFDVLLRWLVQTVVMTAWGLFALALIAGLVGRSIRFLWMKFHPVRAIVHIENHNMIDAEWVEV